MSTFPENKGEGVGGPPELSVVVPIFNEEETLELLVERLHQALAPVVGGYELIFVDDGSNDRSGEIIRRLHDENHSVKLLTLSRNFGHQLAISCGLDFAVGRAVVCMDGDLQDPPEVLPQMLERWREGYEVVYAVRRKRKEGFLKRAGYKSFYWLLNKVSYLDIPLDSGDFSLIDARVVALLKRMPERNRFVRGLRTWLGFRQTGIEYERAERYAGDSKYGLAKLIRLAFDGLVSYSFLPLRLVSNMGLVVSVSALSYMAYLLVGRLFLGQTSPVSGWVSTVVIVLFIGGVQLLSLGIIGEYVGRIFDEVKMRPRYVVKDLLGLEGDTSSAEAWPQAR